MDVITNREKQEEAELEEVCLPDERKFLEVQTDSALGLIKKHWVDAMKGYKEQ